MLWTCNQYTHDEVFYILIIDRFFLFEMEKFFKVPDFHDTREIVMYALDSAELGKPVS